LDHAIRRCLVLTLGVTTGALVLLAVGTPGATLLAVAPAVVCLGAHLVIGHGSASGSGGPPDGRRVDATHGQR
jgi:hypothetical protein